MTEPRAEELVGKLEKGRQRTFEIFNSLDPEQWQLVLYDHPVWQVRDLLAHFVSAEDQLRDLSKEVASGGVGSPPAFDIDGNNAAEQSRLKGRSRPDLMDMLDGSRQETIAWVKTLTAAQLDLVGRHPALGGVTLEIMLKSIYGHQLIHMRDLQRLLGKG